MILTRLRDNSPRGVRSVGERALAGRGRRGSGKGSGVEEWRILAVVGCFGLGNGVFVEAVFLWHRPC